MCCMNTTITADRNNYIPSSILGGKISSWWCFTHLYVICGHFIWFYVAVSRPCHLLEFYPGEYVDETILSAFISSPGPTVQIIFDIRKSFSWKSNNLMHSDALLAEKNSLLMLYFTFLWGFARVENLVLRSKLTDLYSRSYFYPDKH